MESRQASVRNRRPARGLWPGSADTSSPSNARRPVSISKSTHPNAQMSARLSTGLPRACSGLMYAAVPRMSPSLRHRRRRDRRRHARGSATAAGDASIAFASPKSSTFTVPSGADLDVRRLQIAMDDALLVRGFERFGDLLRDRQRLVERDRALRDAVGERRPFDQLHHQRRRAVGSFQAVDGRDVADGSARRGLRASRWNRASRSASAATDVRQDLDRDCALQVRVGGPIHLAHPAHADLGGDFVRAEASAWCE